MLAVYTARMGYVGPDWLDISLQGNMRRTEKGEQGGHRGVGFFFCPSPDILYPYLSRRKHGQETDQLWRRYADDYTAEMRQTYRRSRQAWTELLSWERVVLLCMCEEAPRCHRTVLAQFILPKLGAEYCGELAL